MHQLKIQAPIRLKKQVALRAEAGVALLEVLMAILIFSFGILGVIGLQAAMIKNTADAKYRAQASFIAQSRLGQMWVNQGDLAGYAEDQTDISQLSGLPNGKRTTERGGAACNNDLTCFCVTVSWQQPGYTETHQVTTLAHISEGL